MKYQWESCFLKMVEGTFETDAPLTMTQMKRRAKKEAGLSGSRGVWVERDGSALFRTTVASYTTLLVRPI